MPARGTRALKIVLLLAQFGSLPTLAQAGEESYSTMRHRGVDVTTHRFRPLSSPDRIASGAPAAGDTAISAYTAQQVGALLRDKQGRNAAQRKISSKLIYTARMLRGLPAAPDVPSLETGVDVDNDGSVLVDITANVSDEFLAHLKQLGSTVYSSYPAYHSVRALVPAEQLESVAAWPGVVFIRPRQEAMTARYFPRTAGVRDSLGAVLLSAGQRIGRSAALTGQGSKTSEGDLTHRAFDARMAFGVNGAGIKIGILSDGSSNLAASQALGDLPGDVTILPGQTGGGDEGTAMMEIVHDLAPGAKLYFATALDGVASFAQNIRDLRAVGCDIIIDDVFYFDENPFVDGQTEVVASPSNGGLILQAVNDVTAAGAFYFSSAGNEGNLTEGSAGVYESDFVDAGSLGLLPGGGVHLFGTKPYDTIAASGGNYVMLFWSDPPGASGNDFDLFVLNSTGTAVLEASTDVQDGTQDPLESLSPTYNTVGNRLVVFKNTGAQGRFFHLNTFRGELAVATAGETHGHSHAALAYSVAASPALRAWGPATRSGPYPNPFTAANQIELFSSDGPRRLFYRANGAAITPGDWSSTGGLLRQKPDITAADGVSVTGIGSFPSPFYGTSAAAPHAGAIAALLESANPSITREEMHFALTGSAVDIMSSGADRDSGAGIVMAFEAMLAVGTIGSANPELGTITASDHPGNGNGVLEAGEEGIVSVELKNTGGVVDATAVSGSLTSSTPGVTLTPPGASAYADLSRLTGAGNNLSPFTFSLGIDYPCGQAIDFSLSVSYTGGPSPRLLRFSIPTGPVFTIDSALGGSPRPSPMAGVVAATGRQTGRPVRNGIVTTCETTPKAWPGTFDTGGRQYDSYSFTASANACTTFTLTSIDGVSLFLDAYSPSFHPIDIPSNYSADAGTSSSTQSFSMVLSASETYVLAVHDVSPGAASGSGYNLQFSGCAIAATGSNHPPIALAQDVSAVANSNHTANASVDNGSYDPDSGDTINLQQTPAGPYAVGATPIVLTVTDNYGATAQASATLTVVDPNFDFSGLALPEKTVTAGGTVTQTITVRANPAPWNLAVTFACSGLPALSACTFNPATVMPGANDATTTLTIGTTGRRAAMERFEGGSALAIYVVVGGLFGGARRLLRRKSGILVSAGALVFGILSLSLIHCGGGSPPVFGTLTGHYTIRVTATSGGVSHSANFSLVVN